MANAPAFQLYAKDFYTGTAHFSGAELGAYIRGLTWSWDNGPLPANMDRLARVLLVDVKEFRKVWPVVSEKWDLGDGGYTNRRLEEVRQEQSDYRQNRSNSGAAGAKKRWGNKAKLDSTANSKPIAQPMAEPSISQWQNDSSSPAPSSAPAKTPRSVGTERSREAADDFAVCWAEYPRKTGKAAAWKAWERQKPSRLEVLAAIQWQRTQPQWVKDDGQFVPHMATWLNQRRWEDEPFEPLAATSSDPNAAAWDRVNTKLGLRVVNS